MPNGFSGRGLEERKEAKEGEEEGRKRVTEQRGALAEVVECITSRDGNHLREGPSQSTEHTAAMNEGMNECAAQFPFIWWF